MLTAGADQDACDATGVGASPPTVHHCGASAASTPWAPRGHNVAEGLGIGCSFRSLPTQTGLCFCDAMNFAPWRKNFFLIPT